MTLPLPVIGGAGAGVVFLNAEPALAVRSSVGASWGAGTELFPTVRSTDGCLEPLKRPAARAYLSTDESRLGGRL